MGVYRVYRVCRVYRSRGFLKGFWGFVGVFGLSLSSLQMGVCQVNRCCSLCLALLHALQGL